MRIHTPLAFAIAALIAGAAMAQDNPPDTRQACRASALALCREEALSGDRQAVRACMIKNFDKATPECQAAMKARARMEMDKGKPPETPPKS